MESIGALPAAPQEITPEWLTRVFRDAGVLRRGRVAEVHWEPIGEDRGFTGVVVRLHLGYAGLEPGVTPPRTLVAKLPTAERVQPSAYRAAHPGDAVAALRHFERSAREARFYRDIAADGSLAVPRPYLTEADEMTGRVVLLLEDLAAARPGDVLAGCSAAEAALVLEAVAPIHARWWVAPHHGALDWLPRWGDDPAVRQKRYAAQVGRFQDRYGHQLLPELRDLVDRLKTRYAEVLSELGAAPSTLIHADLHLDNVAFNPPGGHPPAVVLDWQGVARGAAAIDVALFLFGSLAPDERRANEDELIRRYHARLVERGVGDYPLSRFRADCRRALLWMLAGTIGWLAHADPDQLEGRERAVVEAAIEDGRLVSALMDHHLGRRDTS